MEAPKNKEARIAAAQEEIHVFAADAERLWSRIQALGEELDEPLSEVQAQSLEPESLASRVAALLLTSDDVPLAGAAERLTKLARLRQEDVERSWKVQLPIVLAEEAVRRLNPIAEAAEGVLTAAAEGGGRPVTAAMEALCRRMESDVPQWKDLADRCRRYLAGKA